MFNKDTRIKAIHIYSELNEQIDFVVVVRETEDIETLTHLIDDACEDWLAIESNPHLKNIPICDFISNMLDMAGITHWIFGKYE